MTLHQFLLAILLSTHLKGNQLKSEDNFFKVV